MRAALLVLMTTLAAQEPQAPAPARLEGRVTDQRGEPMPAAEVWVAPYAERERVVARTRCDGDGVFLLPRVPVDGPWLLCATSDGKATTAQYVGRTWGPSQVRLHDAATVTGFVRDAAGIPVPGAPVRASLFATRAYLGAGDETTTDANGAFALKKVPIGPVVFRAIVPGGMAFANLLLPGDGAVDVVFDKKPTKQLQVEVTGVDPARLRGVRFEVRPDRMPQSLPAPWARPALDEKGRCALVGIPNEPLVVSFDAPGLVFEPREVSLVGPGPHHVTVKATASDSDTQLWHGVLCNDKGDPLPGVDLLLRDPSRDAAIRATTGKGGIVRFACPWPSGTNCWIAVDDERFVLDQPRRLMMPSTWNQHEDRFYPGTTLRLRAIAACSIRGRIVRADGTPVMLATAEVQSWSAKRHPNWAGLASATTDRDGQFAITGLHASDDPLRIAVQDEAGAGATAEFALANAGTHFVAPDLRLTPMPGIGVWLRECDPANHNIPTGGVVEVLTDRHGRYRFLGVPPGTAHLQFGGDRANASTAIRKPVPAAQAGIGDSFPIASGESVTIDLLW